MEEGQIIVPLLIVLAVGIFAGSRLYLEDRVCVESYQDQEEEE